MTLAQLYDQLAPSLPSYARKDVQTAVRVLAKALQCTDPQQCSPEHYHQPLPTLLRLVEDLLLVQGKGPHTIRNIKNYLSRLFRLAEEQHVLSLAPVVLIPSYARRLRSRRPGSCLVRPNGSYLLYRHWPEALQHDFAAFKTWASTSVVPGRPAQLRKRFTSLESYRKLLEGYFGYLHHRMHRLPTYDDLFDLDLVTAYVHWHVNECHQRPTITIRNFLKHVLALTRQYRPNEELRSKLLTLLRTLPLPPPLYDKNDAWVSLALLDEIGRAIWPRKQPHEAFKTAKRPGLHFAVHAGISLMLRLWTWIPYRQRNIREMRLGDNLHKDSQGHWRITFHGEQLKIGTKHGKTNTFSLPFPPQLVPVLEQYLDIWRPLLLAKGGHPTTHVFLTQHGNPYEKTVLLNTTSRIVYRYTGKYWHPHIVRTVWATEWIRNGGDFFKAAVMLNDTLETVMKNYAHLRDENVAEEVYEVLGRRNGQGK